MTITLATFLVDPLMPFAVVALAIAFLFRWNRMPILLFDLTGRLAFTRNAILGQRHLFAHLTLWVFGLLFFCLAELPCYFDLSWMQPPPWTSGHATCNHFMWHGYFTWPFSHEWLPWFLKFDPPIPSYHAWWSWPWLIANFAFQCAVGSFVITQVFQNMVFTNGNADNWSRPKR